MINFKVGKVGWYVTASGILAILSWFGCCCKQFSLETASAQWIFVFNCCSRYPCFIKCFFKVHGSTSEDDSPPNKFVGGGALDNTEWRFCIDVGGNYPSRGIDVCPWA